MICNREHKDHHQLSIVQDSSRLVPQFGIANLVDMTHLNRCWGWLVDVNLNITVGNYLVTAKKGKQKKHACITHQNDGFGLSIGLSSRPRVPVESRGYCWGPIFKRMSWCRLATSGLAENPNVNLPKSSIFHGEQFNDEDRWNSKMNLALQPPQSCSLSRET